MCPGAWAARGSGPRLLADSPRVALSFLSPPRARPLRPLLVRANLLQPRWKEGGKRRTAQMEESLLLLSSPFLPAPDSSAFVFQVGSHFHLQVSDKPMQTSPTHPGPSQTGEGAGKSYLVSA